MNKQLLQHFDLQETWRRSRSRLPLHEDALDILPDIDFSTEEAIKDLVAAPSGKWNQSRRNFADHSRALQKSLAGKSYIVYLNAISISYLRRRTPHTDKAKAVFFRIWDEQADWMARNLGPRWLISSLQTFSDHGRTEGERMAGAVGFMYGNLIKAYEVEFYARSGSGSPLPAKRFRRTRVENLGGYQPGDDILRNINLFAIDKAAERTAGAALLALIGRIKDGETIFQRVDALAKNVVPRNKNLYLSYGEILTAQGVDGISTP